MAGEFEMEALAAGAIRVLSGEEQPKEYTGIPAGTALTLTSKPIKKVGIIPGDGVGPQLAAQAVKVLQYFHKRRAEC